MYRFFDLIFLLIFSIPILCLFIITFFLCFLFQGRPIFFNQTRGGFRNKKIIIYKFRSMENLKNQNKITKLGKILRTFKLDEVPQFYNILIGELSVVGPRPLHFEYKNFYNNYQKKRFLVKPGLTGYTQVYLKNNDTWKKKLKYDVWYVDNKNLILDINILFKTIYNLIFIKSDDKIPKKFNGKN
jgi:lipopolysaccharide/colanic/teichoic acid biosynthesis glycosyltransferase